MAATTLQSTFSVGHNTRTISATQDSSADKNAHVTSRFRASTYTGLKCNVKVSEVSCLVQRRPVSRSAVTCVATPVDTEVSTERRKQVAEDLAASKNYKITELEAVGVRDWNPATVLGVQQVAEGVRCITVETEVSRELVALDKAYTKPGQSVQLRLSENDPIISGLASSCPFPQEANANVLYKLRGDIPAGSTKLAQYTLSVRAPLELHVTESSASAIYNLQPGASLEVGPFGDNGMDLRPIMFLTRFPTLLIFASGDGIAPARALVEAKDVGTLYLNMRQDVRLYYSAPTPSQIAYKDRFSIWEKLSVKVRATVDSTAGEEWSGFIGSFSDLFDEDDLEYDPDTTGVVLCGSKKENEAVMKLLEEAGIPEQQVVRWEL